MLAASCPVCGDDAVLQIPCSWYTFPLPFVWDIKTTLFCPLVITILSLVCRSSLSLSCYLSLSPVISAKLFYFSPVCCLCEGKDSSVSFNSSCFQCMPFLDSSGSNHQKTGCVTDFLRLTVCMFLYAGWQTNSIERHVTKYISDRLRKRVTNKSQG